LTGKSLKPREGTLLAAWTLLGQMEAEMRFAYGAAVTAAVLVMTPAEATPITYTVTGVMDGVFGSGGFSNAKFTVVGKGDTAGLVFPVGPNAPWVRLSSMIITYNVFGPHTLTATGTIYFFANNLSMSAGFADVTNRSVPIDVSAAGLETYDAASSIGPLAATPYYSARVMTDQGEFTFLNVRSLTFQAVKASAVPEPGTFFLLGAGLLGLVTRRRAKAVWRRDICAKS
jgi:hypothetical protein